MLSLLLNKNPWLSLCELWCSDVWQERVSEVSRREEDRSIDKLVDR